MLAARRAAAAAPAKAASKAAVRVRSVVVRAAAPQQQQQALVQKAKAVGKALLAQAILAAPAFAEEGKLFDFNATLPVVRPRRLNPRPPAAAGHRQQAEEGTRGVGCCCSLSLSRPPFSPQRPLAFLLRPRAPPPAAPFAPSAPY